MDKYIATIGEIMLRLSTPGYERISQSNSFNINYGGGEANVAVSLALLGNKVRYITKLPSNPLGQSVLMFLKSFGIDTEYIPFGGERLGIYFLETGASVRPSLVVYDRAHSSFSTATKDDFNWDEIFRDTFWFHTTGITPAVSQNMLEISIEAVKKAKEHNLNVSCDLNYRKKLWSRQEAREIMSEIVKYTDLIIANEEDAADVFGIEAEKTNVTSGEIDIDHYKSVAKQLKDVGNAGLIAITLRESISASDNNWSAMLYDGENFFVSRKYKLHIVDRVGGGDSFGAGLIHSLGKFAKKQEALEFAVAASALKQTIVGDVNYALEEEIVKIMGGDLSGRLQR